MRKLVVVGIIYVAVLVAWWFYLEYDTKQFIQGLPQPRKTGAQHQAGTPQTDILTPAETENTATETLEKAGELVLSETPADFTRKTNKTKTNTVFDAEIPVIEPETDNSGLSPELEKLFTEYHPISRQRSEIAMELNSLKDLANSYKWRTLEILTTLNGEDDEHIQKTLDDEFNAIKARRAELTPQIKELEEMRAQLDEQISNLLAPYRLKNSIEFGKTYGDMFKTWQTQNNFP